jgi:hypothetical protein
MKGTLFEKQNTFLAVSPIYSMDFLELHTSLAANTLQFV